MRLSRLGLAAVLGALALPVLPAGPASAADVPCEGFDESTTEVEQATSPSVPYQLLGVDRATRILAEQGIAPGEGVNVAVIDSGVASESATVPLRVVGRQAFGVGGGVGFEHGTNVAGLVAAGERERGGPTGIAPAAGIWDLKVYEESDDAGLGGVPTANVVAALRWLTQNARTERIGVVVMPLSMPRTPELKRAVTALSRQDVVIVAGSGNRPQEGQEGFERFGTQRPGEDAAGTVFPAAYADHVLAVTATADGVPVADGDLPDASGSVLRSADIDAAVPTAGAVTLATNGSTCVINGIATSWAAGIAGGVVALLRSAYPGENADQIEARLLASASGSATRPTTVTGHGVLQPVEALTQDLAPTKRGEVDDMPREEVPEVRATAPRPEPDPVAGTLVDARWWGLVGGAALVVALLARPLLARRRSR